MAIIKDKARKRELGNPADDCIAGRQRLELLYAPIREELTQFEQLLQAELKSQYPAVDQLAKHAFRLGGKRLRPALLLLTAKAAGQVTREHLLLAAVVEMIHTATLVHDDVLDSASMRRHLETINSRWGNQASVLLGDFLFTHAFYLASTLASTAACQMIGRATNLVCEGELRQVANQGNLALSEAEYLSIIGAKTAELCACCCQLGAHYAGAELPTQQAMARFGYGLGVAFQIVDDLLDLVGDEAATGKSLGTDLNQQKLTLPMIRLLGELQPDGRREAERLLAGGVGERRDWFLQRLRESDALEYAQRKAKAFAAEAREQLNCLPPSAAKNVLLQIADFVVERRL